MTFYYSTTGATFGHLTNPPSVGLDNFETVLSSHAPAFTGVLLGHGRLHRRDARRLARAGHGARAVTAHRLAIGALDPARDLSHPVGHRRRGHRLHVATDVRPADRPCQHAAGCRGSPPVSWLTDRATAIAALVVANIWASYGIVLLIMSGALANVQPNLILSGQIDGASYARIVRRVILPSVRPLSCWPALVALVSGLNVFDLIYVMTGGGPVYQTETLALEMFRITPEARRRGPRARRVTVILFSASA